MSATRIVLNGRELEVRADENILDVCLRSGEQIPFSCRGGVCHACLLQCTEGTVPPAAQRGLAPALQAKGYLLACQCQPEGPMSLAAPNPADQLTDCMLHEARIENGYLFLCFESARELPGKAGQFFLLQQPSGAELRLEITGGEPQACQFETLTPCPDPASLPAWLRDNVFGQDFQVAGPLSPPPRKARSARCRPPTQASGQNWKTGCASEPFSKTSTVRFTLMRGWPLSLSGTRWIAPSTSSIPFCAN